MNQNIVVKVTMLVTLRRLVSYLLIGYLLVGCSSPNPVGTATTSQPPQTEQAVAPEQNPPGDIPDTQAFITYSSPQGHYNVEVPEGWARTEAGVDVRFVDK